MTDKLSLKPEQNPDHKDRGCASSPCFAEAFPDYVWAPAPGDSAPKRDSSTPRVKAAR